MFTSANSTFCRYLFTTHARSAASKARVATKVEGPSSSGEHQEGSYKIWRNLSLFVAFPAICLSALYCVLEQEENDEHKDFVKYEYKFIRTKRFPWSDGNRSLFHNPTANALPEGYEDAN